tara:strand:- start:6533 stop:7762 length:1230 start_codon:yes stop_codon:yes gene_type:complete
MAKEDLNIILFTKYFPFNKEKEQTFILPEINELKNTFKNIYLVPEIIIGNRYDLSNSFNVEETLAMDLQKISFSKKIQTLFSFLFIKELFNIKFKKKKIRYAFATLLSANVIKDSLIKLIHKRKIIDNLTLSSFWFDFSTLGFVLLKKKHPNIVITSRCHNYDLYGNEENSFYVPYQRYIVSNLDAVYPDSKFGVDFIKNLYPKAKCFSGLMGINDVGFQNKPSNDNVFRIISCAHMIKRKRIDLFLDSLILFSQKHKSLKVNWIHVGDGPERDDILKKSSQLEENCKANFMGYLDSKELMKFYKNNPIDLFVNTSSKEGTPVSLMEAICCGIPLMVTDFGGNREIANSGAGFLISENPSESEIADKLYEIINSDYLKKCRHNCRVVWEENYNSKINYKLYANHLISLK